MSDNSLNREDFPSRPAGGRAAWTTIAWAVGLAGLLLPVGAAVAVMGVVTGLLVFNGCSGASSPVGETLAWLWIFGLWPLAVLVAALLPPLLLGRGRGLKQALLAFGGACLAALLVWLAWLGLGYFWLC